MFVQLASVLDTGTCCCCVVLVCREPKRGFLARLTRRGAKKDAEAAAQDEDSVRRVSRQADPAAFPEVKSRRSTLPPLYPAPR